MYDAEMRGLFEGLAAAIPIAMRTFPTAHHIVLCADNTAAIESILDLGVHSGQHWSRKFCDAANEFLGADAHNLITIRWTPGHRGIKGNEMADRIAKSAATSGSRTSGSGTTQQTPTFIHMRRRAKEKALEAWTESWRKVQSTCDRRGTGFAAADYFPPKLTPQPHFTNITNRRVYGLVTQCRTGHAFTGEYYSRFVPTEDVACPCGTHLQTRKHILLECPRYEDARNATLLHISVSPTVNDILGTQDGIRALSRFIAKTGAFTKTGDTHVADPHETVYEPSSTRTRRRSRRNAALNGRRVHEGC